MNIYLLGYMGSGKSTVGKQLAEALQYDFLDFDAYIVSKESMNISDIFLQKGEVYFRKIEAHYLNKLIQEQRAKTIIALGGGTPCYGTNMEILKKTDNLTLYLNVPYKDLAKRLWNAREERPLVAGLSSYDDLEDYIRKHLFERAFYYNQAHTTIKVVNQSPQMLVEEIVASLF